MALRPITMNRYQSTNGTKENTAHNNILAGKGALQRNAGRLALGDIGNKANQDGLGKGKKIGEKPSLLLEKKGLNRNAGSSNLVSLTSQSENVKVEVPMVTDIIAADVEDIDSDDFDNPQLCAEYINDIYYHMRRIEQMCCIRKNYLDGQQINEKMRTILIDWLIQVHLRFHLLQETLYLTINILDRFLQSEQVHRSKLQLVGVTAMLVAAKYEEIYAPEVADFVYITDNAYTKSEILNMEVTILKVLDYNLGIPLCLHFLRRDSKAGNVDSQHHTMAKYFMELCLPEYSMLGYLPSEIAGASLYLSIQLCNQFEWNATLQHYSGYSEQYLIPIARKIGRILIKSTSSKYQAVRTKYSSSKFLKISLNSELQPDKVLKVIED